MGGLITHAKGYGIASLDVLYRLPDSKQLVEEFIYQDYDHCPEFPRMQRFLLHWKRSLDGPLVTVTVWHELLDKPMPILSVDGLKLSIGVFTSMEVIGKYKFN